MLYGIQQADLVSKIAQKSNLTKAQAEAAVNAFQDAFVEAMKSGEGLKLLACSPLSASSAPLAPAATRALASRLTFRLPTAFVSPLAPC